MTMKEREWFLKRLNSQIKKENDDMKAQTAKGKGARGPKMPKGRHR